MWENFIAIRYNVKDNLYTPLGNSMKPLLQGTIILFKLFKMYFCQRFRFIEL